jgi:membrane-associated protein
MCYDLAMHFDLPTIIQTIGHIGVIAIIFAESGLFFGFFLPGDSLLFTAGLLAAQGYLSLPILLVGTFLAAVLGDNVGYAFGRKVGPRIFSKDESVIFSKKRVTDAHAFFLKYGPMALVLARFTPGVRTFTPIMAGVAGMHYPTFMRYNLLGGFIWSIGMTLLGYLLGNVIPDPDKYLLPLVFIVIIVSLVPVAKEWYKNRQANES